MGRPQTLPEPEPRKCQFEYCGKMFTPRRKTASLNAIYCSRFCQRRALCFERNTVEFAQSTAAQRGDKLRGRGKGWTMYTKRGGQHEHRAVAEEKLGRTLLPGETVHHRDLTKKNNDPDNIVVLQSQAEHMRVHAAQRKGGAQ